jgi:hypothetical protein
LILHPHLHPRPHPWPRRLRISRGPKVSTVGREWSGAVPGDVSIDLNRGAKQ